MIAKILSAQIEKAKLTTTLKINFGVSKYDTLSMTN